MTPQQVIGWAVAFLAVAAAIILILELLERT